MCESARENKEINIDLRIDWSKFKSNAKGKHLEVSKNGYIEFCKMLDEIDFELVGDYTNATEKIELTYKLDNDIKLNISSDSFKRSIYKSIIIFKNDVIKSNDRFIRFIGLTNKGSLISLIKTFDGGIIDIDISRYKMFANSRIFFLQ